MISPSTLVGLTKAFKLNPEMSSMETLQAGFNSRKAIIALGIVPRPGFFGLFIGMYNGVNIGFEEFTGLSANCRYANCSHEYEPGCAVQAAVETGELREKRYSGYIKLKKESEYYEMSYLDKRKKDKASDDSSNR